MIKKSVFVFLLMFSTISVHAATKTCVVNNYVQDNDYVEVGAYAVARNDIYENKKLTNYKTYSHVKCKKTTELNTPGSPNDLSNNNYDILSGIGFYYDPVVVKTIYNCYGKIEYLALQCDYKKANSIEKEALEEELKLYLEWTNGDYLLESISNDNIIVTFDMTGEITDDDIRAKLGENRETERVFYKKEDPKSIQSTAFEVELNKKISGTLWQKEITITRKFRPVLKKIIINGKKYGDVVATCPDGATCKDLDNKLYTDFSMGTGIYPLKTVVKEGNKDVITSECGYIIYNKGATGWYNLLNYRQIDPFNPFPNGAKGIWKDNTYLFSGEYANFKEPITVLNLNADRIKKIKDYNREVGVYRSMPSSKDSSQYMEKFAKYYSKG